MNGRRIFTVEVDQNSPQAKKYHTMYVLEDTGDSSGRGSGPSPVAGDVTWGDIKGDISITTAQQIEEATKDITATLSNKTINAEQNTISNLETEDFKSSALALSSNNVRTYDNSVDTKIVTEKFLQKTLHNIELPEENKDAANKKYVDDLIAELNGKILKFKGFVSTTAPTGSIKNSSLWYESNILPSAFPINVKTYNATTNQWSSTTSQYTPESLDLWANLNDDKGYYWFGNGWNMIDDNGRFLYVSTFTGVIGNPQVLYYLDTAYSTYEKGFYRFIPASGGNPAKFILLNKELFKYVSTFNNIVGDTNVLYYLDTKYGDYKVGFYRYIEAQGATPAKFMLIGSASEVFTDIDVNESLPTTDINANTIYRKATYKYLHNVEELESEPVGYKIVDTENVSVSATGITIDGTETLWEDLTDTIVSGLVTAEKLTETNFTEADFFNYNTTLFDIASNFEREIIYILYYNPTAIAGKYIQIGGDSVMIDNKTIVENSSNELQANAIIEVDTLPTRAEDIKKNTLYKTDIRELKDKDGFYINPIDTYIADGTHIQVLTNGLQDIDNNTLYEWTNVDNTLITQFVNSSYLALTDDYGDEQEVVCIGKLEENVYSYCKAVLNKVLYTYSNNAWKLVADYKDIKNCDEYTISTNVYNKLESKAIIDVNTLPTSGIYPTIIYRILEDVYLYDGEEIGIPQGYRGTSENIIVTDSGITFNSTEYPFATLTDAQFDEITDKETCSFDDAEWFKISSNKYDYNTTVTKEQVYKLYHNPTGQANEYVKIGGEGGSADVDIDNTTITNVNDKLQANAILSVDALPTTNIKEKSVYKIVDKVPEYIDKYYYNGSTTPMNQTPNMYKGDGEHVTFTTTGATINGDSVAYIAITATQIATYEAQGWVLNVDYDEAEALHVSGDTFDSITKLDKQVETAYHDMVKYYYREDGNWVNHSVVNLTQDLYDNLSTEQKTDGTIYVVDDATPVIQRTTYDELANKPSINGITLQDALSLEDLSLYSRSEVNALLENKGQVEFVNALPATPTTNTWYYSKKFEDGTDVPNDKRCLYIVDEDTTVYHDMGIVGDIEMETGDTLSGSEHLVTSSQVVKKELSTKINKYGTQVNVETAVNDATLWTMLAQIGTDDKKTDSSMVFNAGTCYLISTVSPTSTAQIYQFIVTGNVGASAINKRITLINPLTNEMFTKVMDNGTWQPWKGGKKYKHTLVRYNNDSFQYTMGWVSIISNKKTMSADDFKTWLNEKGYTTATNPYYWCGGCCGTTEVRNSANTGPAYVGKVVSGVFYDGTNMFFKWDYNGTTQINPARCKIVTEELN